MKPLHTFNNYKGKRKKKLFYMYEFTYMLMIQEVCNGWFRMKEKKYGAKGNFLIFLENSNFLMETLGERSQNIIEYSFLSELSNIFFCS